MWKTHVGMWEVIYETISMHTHTDVRTYTRRHVFSYTCTHMHVWVCSQEPDRL